MIGEAQDKEIERKLTRAREEGMLDYKAWMLSLIDKWCDADNGAQGCLSTANELRNYLKNYLEPSYK